jgi:hypothetical protein
MHEVRGLVTLKRVTLTNDLEISPASLEDAFLAVTAHKR